MRWSTAFLPPPGNVRSSAKVTCSRSATPRSPASASSPTTACLLVLRCLALSCVVGSWAVGCNTGQIGGEVGADPNGGGDLGEGGEQCAVLETLPVDESSSELAAAAPEILESVGGIHETSLAWGRQAIGDLVLSPEAGSSTISIRIEPDAQSARIELRESEQDGQGHDGEEAADFIDEAFPCPDRLLFDADVTVSAANGAFDDTFRATFVASSSLMATTTIDLVPGELEGTFQVTGGDVTARLLLTVADGTVSGRIEGNQEIRGQDAVSQTGLSFGVFPEEGCQVGYPIDRDGVLATQGIEMLEALREFTLTWTSGESTTLSLDPTVQAACLDAGYGSQGPTLVFEVLTAASAADGGIDGTWALEARVGLEEAGDDVAPVSVDLVRQAYLALTYPGADFAEGTGITAIPVDADLGATFSFSVRNDLGDGHPASGELTVMQVTAADCSEEAPEVDPPEDDAGAGVSTPGCDGHDYEEIGGATLIGVSDEP